MTVVFRVGTAIEVYVENLGVTVITIGRHRIEPIVREHAESLAGSMHDAIEAWKRIEPITAFPDLDFACADHLAKRFRGSGIRRIGRRASKHVPGRVF